VSSEKKSKVRYLKDGWRVLIAIAYLAIVVGALGTATTKFETIVLAALIQIYSAVLFNFSLIGSATDVNNYAGFVRFRILASAQGVTENEDGTFEDQEKHLAEGIATSKVQIIIDRSAHGVVSLYALFKIVQAIFFS